MSVRPVLLPTGVGSLLWRQLRISVAGNRTRYRVLFPARAYAPVAQLGRGATFKRWRLWVRIPSGVQRTGTVSPMQPDPEAVQQPIIDLISVLRRLMEDVAVHLDAGTSASEVRRQLRQQINDWPELSPDSYAAVIAALIVEAAQEKVVVAKRNGTRVTWRPAPV